MHGAKAPSPMTGSGPFRRTETYAVPPARASPKLGRLWLPLRGIDGAAAPRAATPECGEPFAIRAVAEIDAEVPLEPSVHHALVVVVKGAREARKLGRLKWNFRRGLTAHETG